MTRSRRASFSLPVWIGLTAIAVPFASVARAGVPEADLKVVHTMSESPSGTFVATITATNQGTSPATGIVVTSDSLIVEGAHVAYVSDDCGAANGSPWTWNVGGLANGQSVVCHLTFTVVSPGAVIRDAQLHGVEFDPDNDNNSDIRAYGVTGVGPDTPAAGYALFRPFADLTAPDETGTPFSFRAHADKLLIVQVCAEWCTPCNLWAEQSPALQAALASAIGAGNFLLVDVLFDNQAGSPSSQVDANQWKSLHDFPGPVLHAEGTNASPVRQAYWEMGVTYNQTPGATFAIPYFYFLAPGCDNQIVARGSSGPPGYVPYLDEEGVIDTSDVSRAVSIATEIWQNQPCVRPQKHRLDRCHAGVAPILKATDSADLVEAAEKFTIAPGERGDIAAVTVVTQGASSFDLAIYADAAGLPGAPLCSGAGLSSTSLYNAPNARRIELPARCRLGPGSYWLGLRGVGLSANQITWSGGVLAHETEFAFRDALDLHGTGCTSWGAAGDCFGASAVNTELCYVLEEPPALIFADGFNEGDAGFWSSSSPPIP